MHGDLLVAMHIGSKGADVFHLSKVSFSADGQDILSIDDLDLTGKGRVLILGPSGCGKTTLLQLMAGLRKAQSGCVHFGDTDLQLLHGGKLDRFRGQNFGFVLQNFHLLSHLNVGDNIRLAQLGAELPSNEEKVVSLVEALNLSGKISQKASSLSQGEAQRVAIARAVVNDPKVIFADEPTSALDDTNAHKVIDILDEQAKRTKAMLVVATHDGRIKDRFDDVIYLEEGKVIDA